MFLKKVWSFLFIFFIYTSFCYSNDVTPSFSSIITNLPRSNENFTGREEILKTIGSLLAIGHNPVVISGFLGTGKTQTARKFAELNKENYDIIWIIDAKKSLVDQLRTLASQINNSKLLNKEPQINVNSQPDVLLHKIYAFLKSTQIKWLFVFDNVQNRGEVLDFLPPRENGYNGDVLITTRNEIGWLNPLKLKKFKRYESINLLKKILDIDDENQLDKLAALLFDHPLSLIQAGCYIRKHLIKNVSDYITLFSNRREDLWKREELLLKQDIDVKDVHDNYQMTAETALRLSLEDLKKHSPLSIKLLFLSSFWHNNKIPEDVLINFTKGEKYDPILDYNDAVSELIKLSFFEKDRIHLKSGEEENTYNMHDLIPVVLQDIQSLENKKDNIKNSLEIFTQFLPGEWDKFTQLLSRRPHLIPHIEAICTYAEQFGLYENALIELKIRLLEYHMYLTRDQETYEKMISAIGLLIQKVKNIDPLLLARFHIDRVYSRAIFREEDKNFKKKVEKDFNNAIQVLQSAPDQVEELFRAYINFSQYFLFQGEFATALHLIDQAETLLKNIKSESTKTLFYFMKAWILTQKGDHKLSQGAINKAVERLEQEENLAFRIYVQQMKSWTDLKMGDEESAYRWATQALSQAKDFFGKNNNELIAALVLTIGIYKKNRGDFEGAEQAIKESIERLEQFYGGPFEVSDQADSNIILGDLYVEKGQSLEAQKAYQVAEKIYDHLYTSTAGDGCSELYTKLAILFAKVGDDFLAKHYFELHKKYFGETHRRSKAIMKAFKDNNLDI